MSNDALEQTQDIEPMPASIQETHPHAVGVWRCPANILGPWRPAPELSEGIK